MILFETSIICVTLLAVLQTVSGLAPAQISLPLTLLAAGLAGLYLVMHPYRWQMMPAEITGFVLLVILIAGIDAHIAAGYAGAGLAIALTLLSAALSIAMPTPKLPAPDGPFPVGTLSANLDRQTATNKRHLTVKLWYPAKNDGQSPEPLWKEIYSGDAFPLIFRFATRYLGATVTHSMPHADISGGNTQYPVILYNHALISFASENTLLMENLASRGYIVASIRHRDQQSEYMRGQAKLTDTQKAADAERLNRLSDPALDRETRAVLSLNHFTNSPGMAGIVASRAADSRFVFDLLPELMAEIPGCTDKTCGIAPVYGALGLSIGGAVATELCHTDNRCAGAVNLDGGIFTATPLAPVAVPYLMVYSALNEGANDFLKPVAPRYRDVVIENSNHLDFHDAAVVMPGLRWFSLLGKADPEQVRRQITGLVSRFFGESLKPENRP